MKWSLKLGEFAGIGVYIHATFLILLAWVAFYQYSQGGSRAALVSLFYVGAIFTIVVLHEYGHALMARRFGIRTRDITLLPIGGMARLERMPDDPRQELLVALAGPAVNVVLAVVFAMALLVFPGSASPPDSGFSGGALLSNLMWINVILALFNLLPAFPMDGGRVLRALLAMRWDYALATQRAAQVGQAMALLFGLTGLLVGNPFLIFIALFVWMGAAEESGVVQMKSAMAGVPISKAMITHFRTLAPYQSLQDAVDYLLDGFQQDFPVESDGQTIGVLTRADLVRALRQVGEHARVADVMQTDFQTADPREMMDDVFMRLKECQCTSLPIIQDGKLVGLVTMDNLGEFMMVHGAHNRTRTTPRSSSV